MKKTVISFLFFALSITLVFLLTACAEKEDVPECQHTYVKETTPPTCTENGFDKFSCTKCDYCYTIQINATGHSPKAAVEENRVEPTCTADGHYDTVVYCDVCNGELSRETITIPATGHSPKAAVEENRVEPTCTALGHYDTVVYCGTCDAEISRSTVSIDIDPNAHGRIDNNICSDCGELISSKGLEYSLNPDGKSYTVTGIGSFTGTNLVIDRYNGLPVTSIGEGAFSGCSDLTSVTIGGSVTSIGEEAFYGCSNLTSVTIGNSVTSIGSWAFYGCSGLTSITIPNSVTSIGYRAFCDCTGLTSVTIGNGVTSIAYGTFSYCESLTSVTIGNGVTSIAEMAFYACSGLTSIKYRGTEEQWNAITKSSTWDYGTSSYTITYNYTGE